MQLLRKELQRARAITTDFIDTDFYQVASASERVRRAPPPPTPPPPVVLEDAPARRRALLLVGPKKHTHTTPIGSENE